MTCSMVVRISACLMAFVQIVGAQSPYSVICDIVHEDPETFLISWQLAPEHPDIAYQLEASDSPLGPWKPRLGYVIGSGQDLQKMHSFSGPSRFFRIRMIGYEGLLPRFLSPDEAIDLHGGHVENHEFAFDEAMVIFKEPSDLMEIEDPDETVWERIKSFSTTESWWRAVDGWSTGNRGTDLVNQIQSLNRRADVEVAYPVLVYNGLRFWIKPIVSVKARTGETYNDLLKELGSKIVYTGFHTIGSSVFIEYEIQEPKETNAFWLKQQFATHPAVESVDFDGYLEVKLAEKGE